MTPIDFIVFDGDSQPNTPAYKVAEAMKKEITIYVGNTEHVIVGYWMTSAGNFVLELTKANE